MACAIAPVMAVLSQRSHSMQGCDLGLDGSAEGLPLLLFQGLGHIGDG